MASKPPVRRIKAPEGLETAGRELWLSVARVFDLSEEPHKRRILFDACRTADVIDQLDTAMVDQSLTVRGSMGQPVINPLLATAQAARGQLAQLLARLNFAAPDDY